MTDLLEYWRPGDGFFFAHPARTVCAVGAQRTISIPADTDQVREAARAADGAFVTGALPFAPGAPATLTVPAVTFIADDGGTRQLGDGTAERTPITEHAESPLRTTPVPGPDAFVAAVEKARARIRAGELDKVVLARMLVAQATHPFDRRALLARLRAVEPDAYTFAAQGFIGASPELLVSREGSIVRAQPLAGTIAKDAPDARARLLSSEKDLAEHAFVAEAVRDALAPACASINVEGPFVRETGTLLHLATSVTGTLIDPAPSSLGLAALLHPTPAVCGTPTGAAYAAIGELEEIDRALYAGLVGWQDERGDGEWAVALRCAEVAGRIALLFAGAGIVEGSDPQAELAETEVKFRAMLRALGYA